LLTRPYFSVTRSSSEASSAEGKYFSVEDFYGKTMGKNMEQMTLW
jgi:hypothetical protein